MSNNIMAPTSYIQYNYLFIFTMYDNNSNMLLDYKINVKLKLASLWTSLMFLYIYADYFELKTPGKIEEMIELYTPVGEVTPNLLLIFSIILIIPSLMIFLSIFLKPILSRWLNIIIASLWAIMSILILTNGANEFYMFYQLYQVVELMVFSIIIWQAWKWPKKESL